MSGARTSIAMCARLRRLPPRLADQQTSPIGCAVGGRGAEGGEAGNPESRDLKPRAQAGGPRLAWRPVPCRKFSPCPASSLALS